jgi:hypothetical protein
MTTRPREFQEVTMRREDWQKLANLLAGTAISEEDRKRFIAMIFIDTAIDPE